MILTRGIHKKVGWMEDEDRLLWRLRRLDRKREFGGRHRRKRANGRTASKQRGVSPRASLRPQLQCGQMWFHCKKITANSSCNIQICLESNPVNIKHLIHFSDRLLGVEGVLNFESREITSKHMES